MKKYTKTCIVLLTEEQDKIIKAFSKARDTSISRVVRAAINNLILSESTKFGEDEIVRRISNENSKSK